MSRGWEGRGGGAKGSFNDRRVRLTVGHTLILDLQVLVGSWAGVREDVRTRDHDTLGPVVAPAGGKIRNLATGRHPRPVFPSEIKSESDSTAGRFWLTCSSYLNLLASWHFYSFGAPLRTAEFLCGFPLWAYLSR